MTSGDRAAVPQTAIRGAARSACRRRRRAAPGDGVAVIAAGQRTGTHVRAGFGYHARSPAGVAQLAEQPSCKRQVSGSIPLTGSQVRCGFLDHRRRAVGNVQ
jgi:hypothetical protein